MRSNLIVFLLGILPISIFSQVLNDDCISSIFIRDVDNYCSEETEFSNVSADPSIRLTPDCWRDEDGESDVWFSFSPREPGVFIQLFGSSPNSAATIDNAALAIYSGTCNTLEELTCSNVSFGLNDILERTLTDLVIGGVYYIRISSSASSSGSFRLCIDQFKPIKAPESDCSNSVVLCDNSSFFIENLQGVGEDVNEVAESCIQDEFASAWYTWTVETSGSLTFTISPNNINDPEEDLDFAVYRLPNGLSDCVNKELVRCMASGETSGLSQAQNAPCFGSTGLREGETDNIELSGCDIFDNNFVAPLNMIEGESYALVVNNFSVSGFGFNIEFGGTGRFLGPKPDFRITAVEEFECDKTITFINESISNTDQITSYSWNFGAGAEPLFATGPGPHDVLYNTFGTKVAALTIESLRGCSSTEIIDFDIAACCADNSDLQISVNTVDLICAGVPEGAIEVSGTGGFPEYSYDVGINGFGPSSILNGLSAGDYTVKIQDGKGCENSTTVNITEPVALDVVVSDDDSLVLGMSTILASSFSPDDRIVTYDWGPPEGLSCTSCPSPTSIPPGTSTYILTITDQDGCTATDEVVLSTALIRPVEAPQIIMPDLDNANSYFWISTNIATSSIEEFRIYDRWGGVLHAADNIPMMETPFDGWNGRVNGKTVNPGVYIWYAKIKFVDNESIPYSGDFTIVR